MVSLIGLPQAKESVEMGDGINFLTWFVSRLVVLVVLRPKKSIGLQWMGIYLFE